MGWGAIVIVLIGAPGEVGACFLVVTADSASGDRSIRRSIEHVYESRAGVRTKSRAQANNCSIYAGPGLTWSSVAEYVEVPTPDGRLLEVLHGENCGRGPSAALPPRHARGRGAVPDTGAGRRGARVPGDLLLPTRVRRVDAVAVLRARPADRRRRGRLADRAAPPRCQEFATLGWSGGGPRALACAAIDPERCRAVATLASVAPYDAAGLDWTTAWRRRTSRSSPLR